MSVIQIATIVVALAATIALLAMRQQHKTAASERRMISMLERVGLDPALASSSEPRNVWESVIDMSMNDVRQRCRQCSTVDECERWLAGKEGGDNTFCPNARVFNALKIICDDVADNQRTASS